MKLQLDNQLQAMGIAMVRDINFSLHKLAMKLGSCGKAVFLKGQSEKVKDLLSDDNHAQLLLFLQSQNVCQHID